MGLWHTLKFITGHPLNRNNKAAALWRFFWWQLRSRVNGQPIVYQYTDKAKLIVGRGMYGATGNLYCRLHEYNDMGFLLHFLRKEDVFADIGANIGSYTVLAAAHCGAHTFSFEPSPATFRHLTNNIALNRIEAITTLHNIAVGAEKGELKFTRGLDTINHIATEDDADTISVTVDKLDTILNGKVPKLIKIDVEGFETEVINGATRTLGNKELKAIIIELNGSGDRYGYDERLIHDKLLQMGFEPHLYNPAGRNLTPTETFGSHNTIYIRDIDFVAQRLKSAPVVNLPGNKL